MANWILSAFADEHSAALTDQIAAMNSLNIPNIEVRFLDGKNISDLTADEAKEAKKLLDNGGIRVSAIGSPLGKIKLSDDFQAHLEKCRRTFEIANILDSSRVRMFSFYLHEGKTRQECRAEVLDKLGAMLETADSFGVTLCHENEGKIYGEAPERCLDLLETFGGKLRCVFDMGNFILGSYDPWAAYEMLKGYIEYFHIKDGTPDLAIVPAGCGEAQIQKILHAYKSEFDRDVILSLEPHLQVFKGADKLIRGQYYYPYQFANQKEAFVEAVRYLRDLL